MRKLMMMVCCLSVVPAVWAAAPYDGSVPLLCAALTIQECENNSGACHPRRAEEVNLPPFVKIDVAQKTIASTGAESREAAVQRLEKTDGRLMLQGGQGGRSWSIVIATETGQMSASVVDAEVGFVIFGACTPLPK
jgi:hypothetical protein